WVSIKLLLVIFSLYLIGFSSSVAEGPAETSISRLDSLKLFADNVLRTGRDRWSGHATPLLADGINIYTKQPVEWIFEGEHFIIHNLASQQNLFRTLVGLTNLTGDDRYRNAAEESIRYHFDHLTSDCGLLRWGGHQIIDLKTLDAVGYFDADCHEFKNNFPFYELMWDVDKDATITFLRAFWNAHIFDWDRLDMNRHGSYGLEMGNLWDNQFRHPEPFFEGDGLTFINAGSDLIYAASMLYLLNKEAGALTWAKQLAGQYVKARHPDTGLGVYQYSKPIRRQDPPEEGPLEGRLTYSSYGDRAENQFGKEFPGTAREGWAIFHGGIYTLPKLIQLEISERLGHEGQEFLEGSVDGMISYAKHAYDPVKNQFKPMWADGTDLTNYEFTRTGYYGNKGKVLKPYKADELFLFSFSRAYRLTGDKFLWSVIRSMFKGLGLGEPGTEPGTGTGLNLGTENSDPYTLFALLEISRIVEDPPYLELANVIGNNILKRSFHKGFFLADSNHINASFNALEPLALLSLEAAMQGRPELIPVYSGGRGYIHGRFDGLGRTYDMQAIWSKTR
ncbi:MAG: hypothetical protein ABR533_12635, partial [Desulfonatronovibrio sp.]